MDNENARFGRKIARFFSILYENKTGFTGFLILCFFAIFALFGPLIKPYDPMGFGGASDILRSPTANHWLGTDDMGRDVLGALIAGSRISLLVGIMATLLSMLLGASVGIVSGYFGGVIDAILMRITDIFLVLPWLPLVLVLAAILGANLWNIILVIGLTSWAGTARVVRAQTLSVKERTYIERAKSLGSSNYHIMMKHILPNVFPVIFANTVLITAVAILSETTLSFLGLGDSLNPSWGMMLHYAFECGAMSIGAYWFLLPPGICVVLVVLGFTFLGYAFDEWINPQIARR
jgi:peptide/nickel transport system permease protein